MNRQKVIVSYGYQSLLMDLDQAVAYMKAVSSAIVVEEQYLSGKTIIYGCESREVHIKNTPNNAVVAVDSPEHKQTLEAYVNAMKVKDKMEGKQYPDQYEQWKKTYLGEAK